MLSVSRFTLDLGSHSSIVKIYVTPWTSQLLQECILTISTRLQDYHDDYVTVNLKPFCRLCWPPGYSKSASYDNCYILRQLIPILTFMTDKLKTLMSSSASDNYVLGISCQVNMFYNLLHWQIVHSNTILCSALQCSIMH